MTLEATTTSMRRSHEYTGRALVPSGWTHPDPDSTVSWPRWNQGIRVTFTAPEDSDTDDEIAVIDHWVGPVPYNHYRAVCREGTQAERSPVRTGLGRCLGELSIPLPHGRNRHHQGQRQRLVPLPNGFGTLAWLAYRPSTSSGRTIIVTRIK